MLWFDVGIKRYTTLALPLAQAHSCGLMQESKDIQLLDKIDGQFYSCGLMQESKDIQQFESLAGIGKSCGLMQESKDIQQG